MKIAQQNRDLQIENATLLSKKEQIIDNINTLQDSVNTLESQAKQAADIFYKQNMQLATEHFEYSAEQERQKYLNEIEKYRQELSLAMNEGAQEFTATMLVKRAEMDGLLNNIARLQAINDAAIAASKRAEEIKNQADFYKLQLSEIDLQEIEMLRNVSPYLRDKEPLNKVIWKVYYEKPTTDLIGRVIGSGIHTGIYKITNLENGMCYVGQAANLADRWKQHIKRGIGADTPTRNKLYPAMIAIGVENFSFEVVEECERNKLDEREDYWQDYFKAKEFGYSIK